MSTDLDGELRAIRRVLRRWEAERHLLLGAAVLLSSLLVAGMADLFFRIPGAGRWISFAILLGAACWTFSGIVLAVRRTFTPESLAVRIERAFPDLDNRLINYIQFAREPGADPWKAAYVAMGPPPLLGLATDRLKDNHAHRRARMYSLGAAALLLLPFLPWGTAWSRALWRMVNPVSGLGPVYLTEIVSVDPGDVEVLQGQPVAIQGRVRGAPGHRVRLDLEPADDRRVTIDLGRVAAAGVETFEHRLSRVTTPVRYRVRAGDARPSPWYTVLPRSPPAFTRVEISVEPPEYTGLPGRVTDALAVSVPPVPSGSLLRLAVQCSTPLASVSAGWAGGEPEPLAFEPGDSAWTGSLRMDRDGALVLEGRDSLGQRVGEDLRLAVVPDAAPRIEILAPGGRVVLPPGEVPRIEFRVTDDYGLAEVRVEAWDAGEAQERPGRVIETWRLDGQTHVHRLWVGDATPRSRSTVYRVMATEAAPPLPQTTRSEPILFQVPPMTEMIETRARLEAEGLAGLAEILDLQRRNLDETRGLEAASAAHAPEPWRGVEARQREIRRLTREVLANPVRPMGSRTDDVSALYANEMAMAVSCLSRLPGPSPERHARDTAEAVRLQAIVLRQLMAADVSAARARTERRLTGIASLLSSLVEGQGRMVRETTAAAADEGRVAPDLVDAQDTLAEDVGLFEQACRTDAVAVRGNDAAMADLLDSLAHASGELRIRADMLLSAEHLEAQAPVDALVPGSRALENLEALAIRLEQVGVQREREDRSAWSEALAQARQTVERLEAIHRTVQDVLDGVRGQTDRGEGLFDMLAEEYVELVRKNRESLLTVPVDLHVFTDLNVGNEGVDDVYSIYQEIEQAAESENATAASVMDIAYAKNLEILEAMREMTDRFDAMEMWLGDEPDLERVTTETLDREEMPPGGIALGALAAQLEDLISDVLQESVESRDAAHDGATTHAVPDWWDTGHQVMEGDIATFGAQGRSGNRAPDHKEQDGRSNVGREGMSVGETAAGSGVLEQGDEHIEARRTEEPTQAGWVALEGEGDTAATGGGRLASGKADDQGMGGGTRRMDSAEEGSWEGMAALLARRADAMYAQASQLNVRVDGLRSAAHHLRQAEGAVARGEIRRLDEHRRMAAGALERARVQLGAGPSAALTMEAPPRIIEDAVQTAPDAVPPRFQSMVAEYYRLLNEGY